MIGDMMAMRDVPVGHVFKYESISFLKKKERKRSNQRPFAVNAQKYIEKNYRSTVQGGWIKPEEIVEYRGTEEEVYEQYCAELRAARAAAK